MATFNGTDGNDSISGSADADTINGNGGNDFLAGNSGDDSVAGGAGNDNVFGDGGNDWVEGGAGNDTVSGGGGQDNLAFREFGAVNADTVGSFDTNWDRIQLDVAAFSNLGATGRFAAGDVRFFAAAGATGGHDADDRIVYNTSTGQLFYDADGNGSGAAQLIATFQGAPNITATDINAFGTATPSPTPTPTPTPGTTINGTNGNDTLIGTSGPDTINGFDGNDSIVGAGGADSLSGGFGNDTLDGTSNAATGGEAHEADTLDGSLGDDTYIVGANDVITTDIGGIDTVRTLDTSWTLGTGLENLILGQSPRFDGSNGFGNELNNIIDASGLDHAGTLSGLGGNDTIVSAQNGGQLFGGDGNDELFGTKAMLSGGAGNDTLHTNGVNTIVFDVTPGAANADLVDGSLQLIQIDGNAYANIGPSGSFAADDARFFSGAGASSGHDGDDRVIYDTSSGNLWYDADGNGAGAAQLMATFQGAPSITANSISVVNGQTPTPSPTPTPTPAGSIVGTAGNDNMQGTSGNDSIFGLGGNDTIFANGGNDWVQGGAGNDSVSGGGGQDIYAFAEYGAANADTVANFDTNWDAIRLDAAGFSNIGATGRFAGGDVRFFAAAGATSAHDADDRIVYNTSSGQLFYDADGAGGANSELIATFSGAPGIAATDITVFGTATPSPTPSPTPPSGSTINGTSGDDALTGTSGNDTINGFDGNDTIDGAGGADSMVGGNGDDLYFVDNAGDSVVEAENGGIDEVRSTINYALPDWVNNLTLVGGAVNGTGNAIENVITGNDLNNFITGGDGNDSLNGLGGADTLLGGNGNDVIHGHSQFLGTEDHELIDGGAGNDTLEGAGLGIYRFSVAPGAANADWITSIRAPGAGGTTLQIDGLVHPNSGPSGRLSADDGRLYMAAGATGGHDADDRLVYNTTSGELFWDADGSGAGAAQLIVKILNGGVAIDPSQFEIINGSNGGSTLNGTSGNDSLVGTAGNDTINGFDGNDTLQGVDGNDSLVGGTGDDFLFGSTGVDTMIGGAGDDVYGVDNSGDVVVEQQNEGIDLVQSLISYTLPDFVNNLTLLVGAGQANATGNGVENVITGNSDANQLFGLAANDTLNGGAGDDTLSGGTGQDSLTGGDGRDSFLFDVAAGLADADRVDDFVSDIDLIRLDARVMPGLGASGEMTFGDARFFSGAGANSGHDADDRIVYDTNTGDLWYDSDGSGSATAQLIAVLTGSPSLKPSDISVENGSTPTPTPTPTPGPGSSFSGTSGNDTIVGTAGNDTIFGNSGNDWIEGRGGNDQLSGGSGQDSYVFREFGAGSADTVANFDTHWDALRFDSTAFNLGATGQFAASDARFFAGAGATAGHDADDRIVYNTSTGALYYDADGAGGADAQLVATIQGAPVVHADDIFNT